MQKSKATREELELRKLELEIKDLARSPWLRPAYLAALLPVALATLGFLTAWMGGYFSDERAKLKQETAQLRMERESGKEQTKEAIEAMSKEMEALRKGLLNYPRVEAPPLPPDQKQIEALRDAVLQSLTVTPTPSPAASGSETPR